MAGYNNEDLFQWWVLQEQQMIMMLLGKLVHPATGKLERNLEMAKLRIDLIGAIEAKTKGNLNAEEERLLGQVLTNLRLNYVQETSRTPAEEETGSGDEAAESAGESDSATEPGSAEKSDAGA